MTRLVPILAAALALSASAGASLADEFGEVRWQGVVVAYNKAIWTVAEPTLDKGLVLTCFKAPCAGRDFVAVKPGQGPFGPINPASKPIYRARHGNAPLE